ncbi:MAG: hypothetical protein H7Y61_16810 [Rhizobiales bacterium]|nr:hypothetical protein [Rhizobacter sp.]
MDHTDHWYLPDGTPVTLRPVRAQDEAALDRLIVEAADARCVVDETGDGAFQCAPSRRSDGLVAVEVRTERLSSGANRRMPPTIPGESWPHLPRFATPSP